PKEGVIMPDGRPMIEHTLSAFPALCDKIAVVGACVGWNLPPSSRIVHLPDLHPGEGPLGAIVTLLSSGIADAYLVACCDHPLLTPELLQMLLEHPGIQPAVFESPTQGVLPFPGYYPVQWLKAAEESFTAGIRSPRRTFKNSG